MQHIYIILKGKKETIAFKSQYDELLHDTIYLRINKPKKTLPFVFVNAACIHPHIYKCIYDMY